MGVTQHMWLPKALLAPSTVTTDGSPGAPVDNQTTFSPNRGRLPTGFVMVAKPDARWTRLTMPAAAMMYHVDQLVCPPSVQESIRALSSSSSSAAAHRSLHTGRPFPWDLQRALDNVMLPQYTCKVWATTAYVKQRGLPVKSGCAPSVVRYVQVGDAVHIEDVEGGEQLIKAPVVFGAFHFFKGDSFEELASLVAARQWSSGLFISRSQIEAVGATVRQGEKGVHVGRSVSEAGEDLVNATWVTGAEELAEELRQQAVAGAAADATSANGADGAAPAPPAPLPSWLRHSNSRKVVHRRLLTGKPLHGHALAAALLLNSVAPPKHASEWWVSSQDLARYPTRLSLKPGAAVSRILGHSAGDSAVRTQIEAAVQSVAAFDQRAQGTNVTNDEEAAWSGTQRSLSPFVQVLTEEIFNADQLVDPVLAFAKSRDI
jgi:hypothetical protein